MATVTHQPTGPGGAVSRRRALRHDAALAWHQVRYEQLSFWRNPQSAFFTFVFPVLIIVLFAGLFRSAGRSPYFYGLSVLQYYVPTIAAMSVLGSCYSQLAIVLATRRQEGILKRVRATPLPAWGYFLGLLAHCILVSVVDVALIVGVGRLFGVPLPTHWAAIAVTLVLAAACFCALGVGVASLIRNAEAAPAVVQLILFPLLFLSGTYLPIHSRALNQVANAAAGAPVQPGAARPVRRAHRRQLAQPGRAGRLGRGRARWSPSGASAGARARREPGGRRARWPGGPRPGRQLGRPGTVLSLAALINLMASSA